MNDTEGGEVIVIQAIFGEVLAFRGDLITGQLLEYGAHTRCELAFLSYFVDEGDTVVDLGAHIGTFTVPLAQRVGQRGRVVAVEADPRNYDLLVANVERAGLSERVRTVNAVVGSPAETYDLVRNPANTGMTQPILTSSKDRATMRGIDMAEVVIGEARVDVVKIVVQGMELDVLRSAEQLLRSKPILYVQVHDETLRQQGASSKQLGNFLRERGFRFFVNVGERNAAHDRFVIEEIDSLADRGPHINVLAIAAGHERLSRTALA